MPKTLLVADDSLTIRKVIGMVLALEDFQITAVDNGIDAIARAREMRPDLVIADVLMPGRSGYEVCETLKSDPATAGTPVLLLAGNFEPFDEARARAARADAHITKPFESQAFLDRVRTLVGLPAGQPMMPPRPAMAAAAPPVTSQPAVPRPSQPMATQAPRPAATGAFSPVRPAQTAGIPQPMPGPAGIPRPAAPAPMAAAQRPAPQPMARPITQPGAPLGRPPGTAPGGLPRPLQPMSGGTVPGLRPGTTLGTQSGFARAPAPMTPGGFPRAPGAAPLPPVPASPTPSVAARGRDPFGLSAPASTPVRGYQVEREIPPPAAPEEMSLDLGSEPAPVAADGGEAQLREALGKASREVIEKIAWEVVPQLAETIVREIAERTMRERDGKG